MGNWLDAILKEAQVATGELHEAPSEPSCLCCGADWHLLKVFPAHQGWLLKHEGSTIEMPALYGLGHFVVNCEECNSSMLRKKGAMNTVRAYLEAARRPRR